MVYGNAEEGLALGMPLYKEVKRKITESLRRGDWKPGTVIPSEKLLSERFGVSMGTIRKAIDELTAEKLLVRHQGRGTFVASHSNNRQFFYFFHVRRQGGDKHFPDVALVSVDKAKADPFEAAQLGIPAGAPVFQLVNRLSIDGEPVIVDQITLPESLFPDLTEAMLRERPSTLYHLYQTAYDVTVIRTEDHLRAVAAEGRPAELLGVAPGAPLLLIIRVALSYRDQPVELRRSYVDTRNYEYCKAGEA